MQGLVGGDNNRTPVFFQGLDNYRIVGDTKGFELQRNSRYTEKAQVLAVIIQTKFDTC